MPQSLDRKIMIRFVPKGSCDYSPIHRTFVVVPAGWMGRVYAIVRREWDRLEGPSASFYGREPRAAEVSSIVCKSRSASLRDIRDVRDIRDIRDIRDDPDGEDELTCEELYVEVGFKEPRTPSGAALNA